jgi:hypothetical protein
MLRKSEGWVTSRWKSGELAADEAVELGGTSRIPYFRTDRAAELRSRYGIDEITDDNLFDDFLRFLDAMDMTHSYKPVWFRAVLEHADDRGRAFVAAVNTAFHAFYLDRLANGHIVERPTSKMSAPQGLTFAEVQHVINQGPFDRFSRMDFVTYARDRAFCEINPV